MGLTALSIYAPGDTITSAWANTLRTNFGVLDARTGGDPGAAGRIAVSDGAASSAWTDDYTAVVNALGYTPANRAGDDFTGDVTTAGDVAAGGNISGLSLSVVGQVAGSQYDGGSKLSGILNFKGVNLGVNGLTSDGTMYIASQEVYWPGNPPPLGSGAAVPSGAIVAFNTAAAIPATGWSRYTALDGRIPIGAGTTFGVTYVEANDYGSSWAHNHSASALGVGGISGNASPTTASQNVTSGAGSEVYVGQHTHDNGGYDVTGSTDDQTWAIPCRAVVWGVKS